MDVSAGQILVDGVNVQDYDLEDLRNKVGYIPPKAVLFSGDVMGNLDFGQSQEKSSKRSCYVASSGIGSV